MVSYPHPCINRAARVKDADDLAFFNLACRSIIWMHKGFFTALYFCCSRYRALV